MPPVATRCTSATAPKIVSSSSGTPRRVVTWAEIRMRCATVTVMNSQPTR